MGVDPAEVMKSVQGIDLVTAKVADGRLTGESGAATFLLAYAMGIILYIALLIYGQQIMGAIVEEKTSRIVEVLASSLTPFQMMLGKVIGVGAVALLQIGIWTGAATLFSTYKDQILTRAGGCRDRAAAALSPVDAAGSLPGLPDLLRVGLPVLRGAVRRGGRHVQYDPGRGPGPDAGDDDGDRRLLLDLRPDPGSQRALPRGRSATCRRWRRSWCRCGTRFHRSPRCRSAAAMSAPRCSGVLVVVWLAGRIYRVGILMYGKKASFGEVFRWIRAA